MCRRGKREEEGGRDERENRRNRRGIGRREGMEESGKNTRGVKDVPAVYACLPLICHAGSRRSMMRRTCVPCTAKDLCGLDERQVTCK